MLEQMLANPGPLCGPVVQCDALGGVLPDFRSWIISQQEAAGYPLADYPGLMRWADGVSVKRPFWRKLRKLYMNPRLFLKDMLKNKLKN